MQQKQKVKADTMLRRLKIYILEEFLPLLFMFLILLILYAATFFLPLLLILDFQWKWVFLYLVYNIWVRFDHEALMNGSRRTYWINHSKLFVCIRNYFPLQIIKTAELVPGRNYILGCFPHGYSSMGTILNLGFNSNFVKLYPGVDIRGATMAISFSIPIIRELLMSVGFCSVNADNIRQILTCKTSRALCICPGGTKEMQYTCSGGKYIIVKKNRKGFVKLALQTGSALVPVFSFGENNLYKNVAPNWWVWKFLSNQLIHRLTRAHLYLGNGRGFFQRHFGILPHRFPVNTVVGAPIDVPKVENPSSELIDEYHEKFHEALSEIFEMHKGVYDEAGENATLQMI